MDDRKLPEKYKNEIETILLLHQERERLEEQEQWREASKLDDAILSNLLNLRAKAKQEYVDMTAFWRRSGLSEIYLEFRDLNEF
jgi:hypothetical protein